MITIKKDSYHDDKLIIIISAVCLLFNQFVPYLPLLAQLLIDHSRLERYVLVLNNLHKVLHKIALQSIPVLYTINNSQINLPQRLPMTKRAATYDIDPHTFEQKQRDKEDGNPIDSEGSHMKNRKIYKISRNEPIIQAQSTSRPSLKILGLENQLSVEGREGEKQNPNVISSLFNTNIFSSTQGNELFTNLFSKTFTKQITHTSTISEKQPDSLEKVKSLDNPGPHAKIGSEFGVAEPPLFTFNQNPQNSIFNNSITNMPSKNIFSVAPTQAFNINSFNFNSKPANSQSLFQKNQKKKEDQGDDQGDSAELQQKQKMEVDPSKSSIKFDYGEQCEVIRTVRLAKFKKDKGELVDSPLTAALLFDRGAKSHYLVVYLSATHKTIFSGLLLKGKSQVRTIGSKEENVQVLAFVVEKQQKKLEGHVLKMQIVKESNDDSCSKFLGAMKQVIEAKQEVKSE